MKLDVQGFQEVQFPILQIYLSRVNDINKQKRVTITVYSPSRLLPSWPRLLSRDRYVTKRNKFSLHCTTFSIECIQSSFPNEFQCIDNNSEIE